MSLSASSCESTLCFYSTKREEKAHIGPNFFVKKSKIKFEDAKSFLESLAASPCTWACSFDIKSGFHHIEISESEQFLGFSWVFDGVTKNFQYTVLPFGLSVGP